MKEKIKEVAQFADIVAGVARSEEKIIMQDFTNLLLPIFSKCLILGILG